MMQATIYSRSSFTSENLLQQIKKEVQNIGLDIELKLVTDIDKFIENNIEHAPTVEFKGEKFQVKNGNTHQVVSEIVTWVSEINQRVFCKKLIVPVDYSSNSANSLEYALLLNKYYNVNLSLVHVYKLQTSTFNEISSHAPLGIERSNNTFKQYVSKIKKQIEPACSNPQLLNGVFLIGFPADEIIKYSSDFTESLTVIGQIGKTESLHHFFGSVSTKVGMDSKNNVLVVPPNLSFKPIKKIAFCIHSEIESEKAVINISNFVKQWGAELHLINVSLEESISEEKVRNFWSKKISPNSLHFHTVHSENIAEGIQNKCEELDIDIVSLNRKERSTLSLIFKRSVTKKLIKNTTVPLLIIHS